MKTVNRQILVRVVYPLLILSDDEGMEYYHRDWSDRDMLRDIARTMLRPHYCGYDESSQEKIRDCLDYYLAGDPELIKRLVPSAQVPIQPDEALIDLLKVAYEEFYGVKPAEQVDLNQYVVDNSNEFVNSLYRRRKSDGTFE